MSKNPAAVALGRLGGRVKSPAKAKASAANGKKGGRPRKRYQAPGAPLDAVLQRVRELRGLMKEFSKQQASDLYRQGCAQMAKETLSIMDGLSLSGLWAPTEDTMTTQDIAILIEWCKRGNLDCLCNHRTDQNDWEAECVDCSSRDAISALLESYGKLNGLIGEDR